MQRYDFMAITHEIEPSEQDETVRQTVAEVEERLAVMLGVPVPTVAVNLHTHTHTNKNTSAGTNKHAHA